MVEEIEAHILKRYELLNKQGNYSPNKKVKNNKYNKKTKN